jgi:multidrug efflux pump subunit AcrA (membrane-fusion protein)
VHSQSIIFREEALKHQLRRDRAHGDLLRIYPRWTRWSYWLLIAVPLVTFLYLTLGEINDYAKGIAIVRDEGSTNVTAVSDGTITEVATHPGQRVEENQLLFRLNDTSERIELERLNSELDIQQVKRLTNPNDPLAQQQLSTIRAERDAVEKRIKERTIRAPQAGTVQDIRVRLRQFVTTGQLLLTIVGNDDSFSVIAILPGQYRPLLKRGNRLRLELTGFPYAYQDLVIDTVGNEVVGPNEVRRFLGANIADSLALQGSSIIVEAQLPFRTFTASGREHEYYDGMSGTAEARIRSRPILFALAPELRTALGGKDE